MFSIILSFSAMFFLVSCLTDNKLSGLIAGLAYSLSPYHFAHAIHPTLYHIETIPFFICSLFLLKNCQGIDVIFISSFAYAVVAYNDGYYGFMCSVIALLFILFYKIKLKKIGQFFLISFVSIIPFIWKHKTYIVERLSFIMSCKADWHDYFNASLSSLPVEHRLFIFPLLYPLAIAGMFDKKSRFWILLLAVSFFLSISEPVCPIFRASTRWGLIVLLCVCVLSGFGVKRISSHGTVSS